jgi:hypothetical protein
MVISKFFGHNRQSTVLGVQDPDSSPGAFRRAGGRSRSLVGWQNKYSFLTTSTTVGFGGEAMGLKPPWW